MSVPTPSLTCNSSPIVLAVGQATSGTSIFSQATSGIVGLGLTGPNLSFVDTIYGGFFHRNPNTAQLAYGMALNSPYSSDAVEKGLAGVIHWLLPDTSAYQGSVIWNNMSSGAQPPSSLPLAGDSDWAVPIESWVLTSGKSSITNSTGGSAVIEPYFPDIYLPGAEASCHL